jgi:pyridinium-3,5-biscarboxylic acid mononucleotide synthase
MDSVTLRTLAEQLAGGALAVDEFLARLARRTTADLGDIQVDLDRRRRCGFPEVVYGEGKTVEQITKVFTTLLAEGGEAFATRIDATTAAALSERFPAGRYNGVGRTFRITDVPSGEAATDTARRGGGRVVVVTAGTTDLPVAEEARETALWMGAEVALVQDVGVAGPQRLIAKLPVIRTADCIVCVAGMEAALPSVVGGHVDCPVIGVPTSVGYGANFGGLAALLSMLNSCAANVTVVNIDAGFKGGYLAGLIAARAKARDT